MNLKNLMNDNYLTFYMLSDKYIDDQYTAINIPLHVLKKIFRYIKKILFHFYVSFRHYSSIKDLASNKYFFKGFITRLDLRYQFTNEFDLRFISEYNDFSEQFFFQPLISWRPNPDTIFYIGGNQNMIDAFPDYNSPHYRVNKTQLFLKLQYLIKS